MMINDMQFTECAEIIREEATNRSKLFSEETDKYNWMDIGSLFLPSEITTAFLLGQLETLEVNRQKRIALRTRYNGHFQPVAVCAEVKTSCISDHAIVYGQMFYLRCGSLEERTQLIDFLRVKGIKAVFHYLPLHESPFYKEKYKSKPLVVTKKISNILIRLPLFYNLTEEEQLYIIESVYEFYKNRTLN